MNTNGTRGLPYYITNSNSVWKNEHWKSDFAYLLHPQNSAKLQRFVTTFAIINLTKFQQIVHDSFGIYSYSINYQCFKQQNLLEFG